MQASHPTIEQSNDNIRDAKPHETWFIVLEHHNLDILKYFAENMPDFGGFSVSKIIITGNNNPSQTSNVYWKYITDSNKEIECNKMDCRVCYSDNLNDFEKNELIFSYYGDYTDATSHVVAASVVAANQNTTMGTIQKKQKRVKWFRSTVAPESLSSLIIRHVVNYPDKINFDTLIPASPTPMGGNFSGWKGNLRSTRSKRNKKINRRNKKTYRIPPPHKRNKKTNKRK